MRSCESAIVVSPQQSVEEVYIRGEWNGFGKELMTKLGDELVFRRTLEPRDYAYSIEIAGTEQLHADNPFIRWAGGREYSLLRVDDCATPILRLSDFSATPDGNLRVVFQYQDGQGAKSTDVPTLTLDGEAVEATESPVGTFTFERASLPSGKYTVRVNAKDSEGRAAEELYLPFWIEPAPFRFESGTMYFAFTDRFRNGNTANDRPIAGLDPMVNYRGGDFAGIKSAIDDGYFESLGVKTIWISPPDANPDTGQPGSFNKLYAGYHGYWPTKARTVQPRFGTMDDLRALTAAAHKKGMRVIADLVLNHVHETHPYFSQHKDEGWFHTSGFCVCGASSCDWEARRLDCWFTPYLPDFAWRNNAVADQLQKDALFWLKEADLDGFRVDAVKHFEHSGARAIGGAVKQISKATGIQYYLVGETFTGVEGRPFISEWIRENELDGQFDFPLYWPIVDAFAKGGSLVALDEAVKKSETEYPAGAVNSPFLGNHDVERFISTAAGQIEANPTAQAWGNKPPDSVNTDEPFRKLRDAMTLVLTLPGVPLIYYGDELGLPGAGDPDNRRVMKSAAQLSARESALLAHVRAVGAARARSAALQSGERDTLLVEPDVYVVQRGDDALVAINRGATDRTVTLTLMNGLATAAPRTFKDVASAREAQLGAGAATVLLPAQSASVFLPK